MQLFIDDILVDMDSDSSTKISLSADTTLSPEPASSQHSISIPMTPTNRAVLADCEQIYAACRFNSSLHSARLVADGCVILEGSAVLSSCSNNRYNLIILNSNKHWTTHASNNQLNSLFPNFSSTLNASAITQSWTSPTPVRWLPVLRSQPLPEDAGQTIYNSAHSLSEDDYHPFIHLRSVVHAVFNDAGYTLKSNFFDSEYFDSFYMSGMFKSRNTDALVNRMDFCAARSIAASATADNNGRVYANPYRLYNSIGNIVDTSDSSLKNTFDNGNCFGFDDTRIAFTPKYAISLGFEYRLKFRTDYRIIDRHRLSGFDKIYLGNQHLYEFQLNNPFSDQRNNFRSGKTFTCIICDFEQGASYKLIADILSSTGTKTGERTIATITSRSATVSSTTNESYANLRISRTLNGITSDYSGDWMLYDGYVNETGSTEVEICVRSAAEDVSPSHPKYFDTIYFAGAEQGMNLTLEEAEIRPVFQAHPTTGSTVSFADIAAHGISCMQLINALSDMFALRFLTDETDKTVFAEPSSIFFRNDVCVDWSDKLDLAKGFTLTDVALDMPNTVCWSYKSGDTASDTLTADGDTFGSWSVTLDNPCKATETKRFKNTLFTPSVNTSNILSSAPAASMPCAGDIYSNSRINNLNFPTKIIRYAGLKTLPAGQQWGWPSFASNYPLAAFHCAIPAGALQKPQSPCGATKPLEFDTGSSDSISLCYEDRNTIKGLHIWWDDMVDTWSRGRRLEAYFKLMPEDIEPFIRPDSLMTDFRARFRLHIDGEWSDWRLEKIHNYDPSAASTKCTLIQII